MFFSESDGDIGCFSDIVVVWNDPQSRALLSLNATKAAFETLETLGGGLDPLDKSCSTLAKTVSGGTFSDFVIPSSRKEVLLT